MRKNLNYGLKRRNHVEYIQAGESVQCGTTSSYCISSGLDASFLRHGQFPNPGIYITYFGSKTRPTLCFVSRSANRFSPRFSSSPR
jgi:hypothetical protein